MKKAFCMFLILAAVFLLAACVQDPFEAYENFTTDLDINARIEDAISHTGGGNTSKFFKDELATLYGDLGSFEQPDNRAHEINQFYSNCVSDLLHSIDRRLAGDENLAQSYLVEAIDYYQAGRALYTQFLIEYDHKNN